MLIRSFKCFYTPKGVLILGLLFEEVGGAGGRKGVGNKALWNSGLIKGDKGKGRVICGACEVVAMRLVAKWNHKGQSLVEYAMVAAIVSAAIVAMSTYVYRSVQATQQMIQEEFSSY